MALNEKISNLMKEAMKEKDSVKLSVIRMIKSSVTNEEKRKTRSLSDEEILKIISKEMKNRNESIEAFKKGGRNDLAEKEKTEIDIIKSVFPEVAETISEDKVKEWVKEIISSFPEGEALNIGKVMPLIMKRTSGKIDGRIVNQIVRDALGS